ncbi:alpha/beta fold hydrolase [Tenacibaculum caenipelagi]|uniref:Pimeloyl-ACP methyl ester carboxylesterase n=1 Tax=Tenacibaculum caenipelagi TaxID=1325435 RepID=A0A4R6TFC3_9FLAO|nr:alpha/beta hydrolase [Tenacibaculum caenipelagi]TDQ25715.1 pimeloyl-ACP methyl ester carboxylesterase [Tenacibaculum caenipelagi]
MNNKIGIIFINGAGLNSSIWNELQQRIDNPVLSIDFPNRKSNGKQNLKLTFDDYINKTTTEIRNWGNDNFIIVAHSIGACIGLKVAEKFKNELKGFVAIGSVVPKSGQSFVSSLPFPQKFLLPILLSLFGTTPPKKTIEAELCNDLTPEMTSKIVDEFTPEAKALYTTKNSFELPDTKRLYIKLTNDKSMPTDLQDKMAKNLNASRIETINSGHLPMISSVKELETIISDFLSEIEKTSAQKILL